MAPKDRALPLFEQMQHLGHAVKCGSAYGGVCTCGRDQLLKDLPAQRRKIHGLFHTLWTKAVDSPTYDKKQWLELESLLGL